MNVELSEERRQQEQMKGFTFFSFRVEYLNILCVPRYVKSARTLKWFMNI